MSLDTILYKTRENVNTYDTFSTKKSVGAENLCSTRVFGRSPLCLCGRPRRTFRHGSSTRMCDEWRGVPVDQHTALRRRMENLRLDRIQKWTMTYLQHRRGRGSRLTHIHSCNKKDPKLELSSSGVSDSSSGVWGRAWSAT